ncbi:ABC-type transport auxiliary lipoprotein family protein [Thiothrix subterranea]|uniref:ABC-type transport auxiliary lipoprotein family protein n=1 Tax=Thiothrix subterranea TaxID=2735563 RepID=A0AA51MQC9_9GAMM|nr:ABC-type transport auxiliary lipoprotein family protein [Thiothrix subterranea]MDQ5768781.1 ABC-type transport auxiliary lipoprotein family protein [Thiothrix subterranea]WML86537.1 ABC-type transport auxiliary lipoprotein family protein [Thiothrix subterranea]
MLTHKKLDETRRLLLLGGLGGVLSACVPLSNYTAADRVYRLAPQVNAAPNRARAHLYLPRVQLSPALDTPRITLFKQGLQQDFIVNSRWPDSLSIYLQAVMLDAFSRSGGFLSVSDQLLGNDSMYKVLLRMSAFHAEYPPFGQGQAVVVVGMEAILIRERDQRMLGQYRYDMRKQNIPVMTSRIVQALNQALSEGIASLITDMIEDLPVLY